MEITSLATFAVALVPALAIRQVAFAFVRRREATQPSLARAFLEAVRWPSILWCFGAATVAALRYSRLSAWQIRLAENWIAVILIISITLFAASVAVRSITMYGERREMQFAAAGLSRTLVRGLIFVIGALFLLRHFGITITPLLTALGVGGLAVALALQDTLANLFAGVHILVEAPIHVGDFIRLAGDEEGVVSDIGWRTTRLLTGGNNTIVIPNTKITSGILTNFSMPDRRVVVEVPILTGLDADAEQVLAAAIAVAAATPGVLPEPPPAVLFEPGVTPTHLQGKLLVFAPSRLEKAPLHSALALGLWREFRERRIPLPAPGRLTIARE